MNSVPHYLPNKIKYKKKTAFVAVVVLINREGSEVPWERPVSPKRTQRAARDLARAALSKVLDRGRELSRVLDPVVGTVCTALYLRV